MVTMFQSEPVSLVTLCDRFRSLSACVNSVYCLSFLGGDGGDTYLDNVKLQYLGSLMVIHLNVFFQHVLFVFVCVRARHIPAKIVMHKGELKDVGHEVHSL